MKAKIPDQVQGRLIESIKRFFLEQTGEEIGDLKAQLFLKFCITEIGAVVYNLAVEDAATHMQSKLSEVQDQCYEPQFTYWKR
jgi:uncharacterized protein (DUF2164 family)